MLPPEPPFSSLCSKPRNVNFEGTVKPRPLGPESFLNGEGIIELATNKGKMTSKELCSQQPPHWERYPVVLKLWLQPNQRQCFGNDYKNTPWKRCFLILPSPFPIGTFMAWQCWFSDLPHLSHVKGVPVGEAVCFFKIIPCSNPLSTNRFAVTQSVFHEVSYVIALVPQGVCSVPTPVLQGVSSITTLVLHTLK